ncbi:MAG TPA: MerR family transcriptional regulator [Actinomycetota bacterium]|nr:MerR family transcriptional regulator [Actinomycetota bacterium]
MSGKMTIDELAREAGTTTRNVRAYQTRGVLDPPEIVGRIGYYTEEHLTRLRLISRLQQRGFGLQAINDLLSAWDTGSSLSDVLGFSDALLAPWTDEVPESISRDKLETLFPEVKTDPSLIDKAVELNLLVPEGDGWRIPSPRLMKVGAQLVSVGIPLAVVLKQAELMKSDIEGMAWRLVAMFNMFIWEPFVSGQSPDRSLTDITKILQDLRPLASEAVSVFLAQAMQSATEAATLVDLQQHLSKSG